MLNQTARAIYDYICERIDDGIPPTIREICTELGIRSTSTVHRYVNLLAEEGYLEKMDKQNRAIRIKGKTAVNVPLIGTVTAGLPITAVENVASYLPYAPDRHFDGPLFALKVRGESMINAGICDGDIVIVEQRKTAENGEIIVALVNDDEATVKRFYKENGGYRLQPENDTMEPIYVSQVAVLGKVVGLLRYFNQ